MKTYRNHNEELDLAIESLERKRDLKLNELKQQLIITYESVKPVNILKQTLTDFKESSELKSNLLETILSLSGGFISKKILIGNSKSIFKKILGNAIQFGVTSFLAKKVHIKEDK